MPPTPHRPFWLGLAALLALSEARAAQDHESLRQAAEGFAGARAEGTAARIEVSAERLDPRLALPACTSPPVAFPPPGSPMTGRTTVGLRCENGAHWTIFVGVMVRAFRPALVAARPLPRGTVLAATDIRIEEREVSTQRGATVPAEPAQVIGTTLRRALEPGEILASTALAPRRLVHRGERISIVAGEGSFRVRMAGEALADAAAGERVRVRNASSGRIVDATVTGAATVEVGL